MSDPIFGIGITSVGEEARPVIKTDMSIFGLVVTAPDANPDVFPYDTPIAIYTNDVTKVAALGLTGTAYQAIAAINLQLAEFQSSAAGVIVRVQEGATLAETIANLRGDINARTGMFALLDAGHELGRTPRLVCVPGYTSQSVNAAADPKILTQGSLMTVAPTVVFSGGGSDAAKVLPTGHVVMGTGANSQKAAALVLDTAGSNLSGSITVTFSGGGADAGKVLPTGSVVVDATSNAIVAAMPTLLDRLLAVAPVDGPASSETAAIAWRNTIASRRIIPCDPAYKIVDGEGDIVVVPKSPYVIGLAIAVDHEHGGMPFHSWANRPIRGIVGTSRPIELSILDGANEGQVLLSHNISVTVRGESTDGAIADGGYVFIGTDTASDDELWTFYNQVRGRDFIHLLFIKALRFYLGKFNISRHAIQAVINTMEMALRDLKADEHILGYRCGFTTALNSPENLRLGKFTVTFAAEEPAPLRYIGIQSARYRPALDELLGDLATQLGTVN